MLFIIIGCETSRNFSVFSSQEAPKKEIRQEEVLKSPTEDASNVIIEKKRKKKTKNKGDLTLSDISVIGEARKDQSEIISFFFDLFDEDSDEVKLSTKQQLSEKSRIKDSKEDLKEKKDRETKTIKPAKIIKSDLIKKQKDEMEESIQTKNIQEKAQKYKKSDVNEKEVSSEIKNIFDVNKNEEELAFYKKEIDDKKKEDISKTSFLKVGMLLPLTGEKKAAGDLVMNSLRYSMSTKPNSLIFKIYDTKGQPSGAVKAAKLSLIHI